MSTETKIDNLPGRYTLTGMGKRVTKKSKKEFADELKAWREAKGLSQSGASERLGVPVRTLQNWEIARTKPTSFTANAILKIFRKGKGNKPQI